MLTLTHASFATVTQLFDYKQRGLELEPFAGYSDDQWGIKAHNRPWVVDVGDFKAGQKIIEVGGAYSTLPDYLARSFELEAWVGDDFGIPSGEEIWSRWGDPKALPEKYPQVKYSFENFGTFSEVHPQAYFDRIFSVSTLEHIPWEHRLSVLKDMNRCLAPGGRQLHSIDIQTLPWRSALKQAVADRLPSVGPIRRHRSEIAAWLDLLRDAGVRIAAKMPGIASILNRDTLVESPDVVYRFYPPNNAPKPYNPTASLLLFIEDL